MFYYFSFMRKIDRWQGNIFFTDIIPDIQLCPVADREHSYIFTFMDTSIISIPKLRSLKLWIPLTKFITNGKNPFFCSCFFFIAAGTTNTSIKLEFFNSIKQRMCLQPVTAGKFSFWLSKVLLFDRIFYFTNNQIRIYFFCQFITKSKCFRKIVTGVNMYQGERYFPRRKCFFSQMHQRNRIFSTTEKQSRFFKLCHYFTENINTLRFQLFQVIQMIF